MLRNRRQLCIRAVVRPIPTQRIYDKSVTRVLLATQADLKSRGWGYGPMSSRLDIALEHLFQPPIPSVPTIAQLLRAAAVVEANPKKSPYARIQREQAMAIWQVDAFEHKLLDEDKSKERTYQIQDDATRKDMGTTAFTDPENGEDAMAGMRSANQNHGAVHHPQNQRKNERSHQTLYRYLQAHRPTPFRTLTPH